MNFAFDPKRFMLKLRTCWWAWLPVMLVTILAVNLAGLAMPKKYAVSAILQANEPPISMGENANRMLSQRDVLFSLESRVKNPEFMRDVAADLQAERLIEVEPPNTAGEEELLAGMVGKLEIYLRDRRMITLRYVDENPDRAFKAMDSIYRNILNEASARSGERISKSIDSLESGLKSAEGNLNEVEGLIQKHREDFPDLVPEQIALDRLRRDALIRSKMENDQAIDGIDGALKIAQQRLASMDPNVVSTIVTRGGGIDPTQQMQMELARMEREMTLLLQTYTDNHPRVQELRNQIALQKEMLAKATEVVPEGEEVKTTAVNPAYQAIEAEILAMETRQSQLMENIEEYDEQLAAIEETLAQVPTFQLALDKLVRERDFLQAEVNSFRRNLQDTERARSMQDENALTAITYDHVLSPAPTYRPVSPDPVKIGALSVAAGFGAAFALVYLLMMFDSALRSLDEARALLQMPVLGVVQSVGNVARTTTSSRRRRVAGATAGLVILLIVVGVGGWMLRSSGSIQQGVETVRGLVDRK